MSSSESAARNGGWTVREARRALRRVGYLMRSLSAAFTAELACRAPRTWIAAMVRRASSGVTSPAMLASPWMPKLLSR
jgi:hypothetical protein